MALRKAWLVFACPWHLAKGSRVEDDYLRVEPVQYLPWKPTMSYYNPEHASASSGPGTLGIELELLIRKDSDSWFKRGVAALSTWGVEKGIGQITAGVKEALDKNGLDFEIVLNSCQCFIEYSLDSNLNVLPMLIKIAGVHDHYQLSNQPGQMRTITLGLMDQLREGSAPPIGAPKEFLPLDEEGKKINNLKDMLDDNPAVKGATQAVNVIDLSEHTLGTMTFSEHQFLIELELDKYAILQNNLPGKYTAALIGNTVKGAGGEAIAKKIYSEVSLGIVNGTAASGINTFVTSPKTASRLFSELPVLEPSVARAFHETYKAESAEDYTRDFKKFEEKETLPQIRDIDPNLAIWKGRREGRRGKQSIIGMRMVVTVTSLSENFASSKLPVLRDGVAGALGTQLEQIFRPMIPSFQVNVYNCGFRPSRRETPPYNERADLRSEEWPHDKQCGEPPTQ
eukprot:TRINITY_DN10587_c0_g1_i1.p1 TRINITY_DN10587_c0_g1~~TRINITY_DN10587_c0_g1_i1.p1  ORF type:complete len:454 (+),score=59.40 TRINITY_DN10587_c0_g1_i1:65-1426(+)